LKNRTDPSILEIFDTELAQLIAKKRAVSYMEALRMFIDSETHSMLENDDLKMWYFSPLAIMDIWECEISTGNPCNSLYLRGDEVE